MLTSRQPDRGDQRAFQLLHAHCGWLVEVLTPHPPSALCQPLGFYDFVKVKKVKIMEGKGSGLVEMSSQSEAEKAQKALNGTIFKGLPLKVIE